MGDPVSTALIIGSTALTVGSGIGQAAGDAKAASFKADQAAAASRAGKIAAAETDTSLREELRSVIGNIRSIRASSGIDPNSPTTGAILANEERVSERERAIRVANITNQADADSRASAFYRQSGKDAFLYGSMAAVGRGFSQLAKAG